MKLMIDTGVGIASWPVPEENAEELLTSLLKSLGPAQADENEDAELFHEISAILNEYEREHRVLLDRSAPAIRAMEKLATLVGRYAR